MDNKISEIGLSKVKLLSIEQFNGTRSKLKGFLSQMRFKVTQEKAKMGILMDQVMYARLFLTGRALEWFKPYLMEIQTNGMTTLNQEIYGDMETATTAERKLLELTQKGSTTKYTTMFQIYTTQTKWN